MKKLTLNEFIERAKSIHDNKYSYDNAIYKNNYTKITITCPVHGDFDQNPNSHLRGSGCSECRKEYLSNKYSSSKDDFVKKANEVHNDGYTYDNVEYSCNKIKVVITCPIHGDFEQTPNNHLKGAGCQKCGQEKRYNIWSHSDWEKAGTDSKNFEGYSVYLLECWDENEHFYKVGKTFINIHKRYFHKSLMPYRFKVLEQIYGDAKTMSELEISIKDAVRPTKYIPSLKFAGCTECFTSSNVSSIRSTYFT
jgi:hypothetical protein